MVHRYLSNVELNQQKKIKHQKKNKQTLTFIKINKQTNKKEKQQEKQLEIIFRLNYAI